MIYYPNQTVKEFSFLWFVLVKKKKKPIIFLIKRFSFSFFLILEALPLNCSSSCLRNIYKSVYSVPIIFHSLSLVWVLFSWALFLDVDTSLLCLFLLWWLFIHLWYISLKGLPLINWYIFNVYICLYYLESKDQGSGLGTEYYLL